MIITIIFDRIKDAFTAFQEISMYVANILVEQKPVESVSDKYRIEKHGFDLKESFRKRCSLTQRDLTTGRKFLGDVQP